MKIEDTAAAILVADKDFGRCPVASETPRALWPVFDKTVVQRLVDHIAAEGIKKIVICSSLNHVLLGKAVDIPEGVDVRFHQEIFPRGTAGSISDAWHIAEAERLIVFHAEIVSPPGITAMLKEHYRLQGDMTIVINPSGGKDCHSSESAQVYICEKSIIDEIPNEGYCDLKETLVPRLVKSDKVIMAAQIDKPVGNFRNWQQYLMVVSSLLNEGEGSISETAEIGNGVRMVGPVVICENAVIGDSTLIIGPTVIGQDVKIGKGCVISESIIWEGSQIGKNCFIQKSLLNREAYISSFDTISQSLVAGKVSSVKIAGSSIRSIARYMRNYVEDGMNMLKGKFEKSISYLDDKLGVKVPYVKWFTGIVIFAAFLWSYWTSVFTDLWQIWMESDEYSSGLLVPLLTVYIIWTRREEICESKITPSLWGLAVFAAAQVFRFFGLLFMYNSAERISMLMTVAALVLLLFGWKILGKLSTVLLFLALMIPLPNSIHSSLTIPLQNWATTSAVYCLETFGFHVLREGNIIHLDGVTVAVAEACNGLRMITSFFVINSMVALLVKRSLTQKLIIVFSSIPVALVCNTIRLTVTSVAFTYIDSAQWEKAFHDFGGFAMMPLALAIILFELWILSNIFVSGQRVTEQVIIRRK